MSTPAAAWQIARSEALEAAALRNRLAALVGRQRDRLATAIERLPSSSTGRAQVLPELEALSAALAALAVPGPGVLPERQLSTTELRERARQQALLWEVAQMPVA
ncbi:MAG: hypothetical protein VKK62_11690 [Synechococcaceae cyanobacterium]|nr:hypothetical protein [Synechococcaceae cyanobacterium]